MPRGTPAQAMVAPLASRARRQGSRVKRLRRSERVSSQVIPKIPTRPQKVDAVWVATMDSMSDWLVATSPAKRSDRPWGRSQRSSRLRV